MTPLSTEPLLRLAVTCPNCGCGIPIRIGAAVVSAGVDANALLLTYRCKRCKTVTPVRFRDVDLESPSTVGL